MVVSIDAVAMIGVVVAADSHVEIPHFARMIDGRNQTSVTMPNMAVNGKWTEKAAAPAADDEVEKVSGTANSKQF